MMMGLLSPLGIFRFDQSTNKMLNNIFWSLLCDALNHFWQHLKSLFQSLCNAFFTCVRHHFAAANRWQFKRFRHICTIKILKEL